ncbi:hypothetical protein [Amycolatopsis sp. PS_44_ISF1]|uniref:hypothetical protein n=1 Tax=Amycolatopsis sp. PS_44_ISF1 TaxID=2974917 RepID=UPI0028DE1E6B|nr:hypothetical protein [Amycolatopsis sp. PS_44_ISF1]MDT8910592.1 hypothetical protein [Amycolatopsis sp. PS_44_ISF1]
MPLRKTALAALALLAPFVAEFLLGDQYLTGPPALAQQLGMYATFVALYGSGALLIREVARRRGRGWPTILVLALAFGVTEEGLLTQTLFNPHYLGLDLIGPAHIPVLGLGATWTVYVLTLHVVWSIATPIAIVEAFFGRTPWLRKPGTWAWSALLVVGAVAAFAVSRGMDAAHFLAAPAQLAGTLVVVVALVLVALRLPARPAPPSAHPWLGFAVGLGLSTAFHLVRMTLGGSPWTQTGVMLALAALAIGYGLKARPPAFPLAAGAAVTYCWLGLSTAAGAGFAAIAEQSAFVLGTLLLLGCATRRNILSTI